MKPGKDTPAGNKAAVPHEPGPVAMQVYDAHAHGGITHMHFHRPEVPHDHAPVARQHIIGFECGADGCRYGTSAPEPRRMGDGHTHG